MTLRDLTPRWWWISALVVLSQPLVLWYVVLPQRHYGAIVSFIALPLAALLCLVIRVTSSDSSRVMRWPACAALTTAATWAMALFYSLPLVVVTFAALSLPPTSRRTWVLGCMGVVVQAGCVLMLVALHDIDDPFLRDTGDWLILGQGLAVWVPAVGIARSCPEKCLR